MSSTDKTFRPEARLFPTLRAVRYYRSRDNLGMAIFEFVACLVLYPLAGLIIGIVLCGLWTVLNAYGALVIFAAVFLFFGINGLWKLTQP